MNDDDSMYDLQDLQAGRGKTKVFSKDPILNKLAKVALRQGEDIMKSQVTYQTIFDSIDLVNGPTSFQFFKTLQNKPEPLANLQVNRFEDGKAMAIETVTFYVARFGTPPNAGSITNILSLQDTATDPTWINQIGLALGTLSITISQQTSIDSLNTVIQLADFNPAARFGTMNAGQTGAGTFTLHRKGYSSIHLPNPIIIAPNQPFQVDLNTAGYVSNATVGQYRLYCALAGRGVLSKVLGTN